MRNEIVIYDRSIYFQKNVKSKDIEPCHFLYTKHNDTNFRNWCWGRLLWSQHLKGVCLGLLWQSVLCQHWWGMNICALYVCTYIHVHTHNKQNDYWSVDTTRAGTLYLQQQLVLSHLSRHPRSRKSDSWNGVSGHCLGSPVSGLSWRLAKRKVHTRAFSSDSGSGTLNSCIQSIYILHIFTYDRIFSDDDLFLWMHANKGSSMLTTLHFGPPWSGHQAAATIPLPECSWLAPWPPRYPVKTASWSSPSLRTKTRRALYWP